MPIGMIFFHPLDTYIFLNYNLLVRSLTDKHNTGGFTMAKKQSEQDLFRGSIIRLRRRCGKPNCRCKDGDPHETWALSYSVNRRTRMLTLRNKDIPCVKKGLAFYKKESAALETRVLKGVEKLRMKIKAEKKDVRK